MKTVFLMCLLLTFLIVPPGAIGKEVDTSPDAGLPSEPPVVPQPDGGKAKPARSPDELTGPDTSPDAGLPSEPPSVSQPEGEEPSPAVSPGELSCKKLRDEAEQAKKEWEEAKNKMDKAEKEAAECEQRAKEGREDYEAQVEEHMEKEGPLWSDYEWEGIEAKGHCEWLENRAQEARDELDKAKKEEKAAWWKWQEKQREWEKCKKDSQQKGIMMGFPSWPGTEGVKCAFVPSGENYGCIGDLIITNTTNEPVGVTVPSGLLLESSDPAVQDLYAADTPTVSPCSGAQELNKPMTIDPGATYVIEDIPGFCPDFEKDPPHQGDSDIYAVKHPDEKAQVLLDTIASVNAVDIGSMDLQVFEQDKARQMMAQGALWMVDSRIDEVEGNVVTATALSDRYWDAFETAAQEQLGQMSHKQRTEAEDLVKGDLKAMVSATSFVTKGITETVKGIEEEVSTQEDQSDVGQQTDLPDMTFDIADNAPGNAQGGNAPKTETAPTCARKEKPGRKLRKTESRSFDRSEKTRLKELVNNMPNFLYNMDMVFMRVDKWAFDPQKPGGNQGGGLIVLTDKFFQMSKEEQERVLKHELGHQWHEENLKLVQDFLKIGWNVEDGKTYEYENLKGNATMGSEDKCPSRKDNVNFPRRPQDKTDPPYSATNPLEDFGVSLELFLDNPDSLKKQSPERYEWMKKNICKDAPAPKAAGE